MTVRPSWIRKLCLALALLLGLAIIALFYGYFQITARIDPEGVARPNPLEAKEAERKLDLYREAQKTSQRGFVRLSEGEINSYLQARYFSASRTSRVDSATSPGSARLLKSRADLFDNTIVWSCWISKDWLGGSMELVWQRSFELVPEGNRWDLRMKGMRLGDLNVPRKLWPVVDASLGGVDEVFINQFDWLTQLPTLEIKTNVFSSKPELRLFTYRLTEKP
jgi:hypothetical protein